MDLDVIRGIGAVLFVLALLASALWAVRRAGWSAQTGKTASLGGLRWLGGRAAGGAVSDGDYLQVLERKNLTPQHAVHLLRAGGRRWLIATHSQGCTLLTELSTNPAANSEDSAA